MNLKEKAVGLRGLAALGGVAAIVGFGSGVAGAEPAADSGASSTTSDASSGRQAENHSPTDTSPVRTSMTSSTEKGGGDPTNTSPLTGAGSVQNDDWSNSVPRQEATATEIDGQSPGLKQATDSPTETGAAPVIERAIDPEPPTNTSVPSPEPDLFPPDPATDGAGTPGKSDRPQTASESRQGRGADTPTVEIDAPTMDQVGLAGDDEPTSRSASSPDETLVEDAAAPGAPLAEGAAGPDHGTLESPNSKFSAPTWIIEPRVQMSRPELAPRTVMARLLALTGFMPAFNGGPATPPENPVRWMMMAWASRQPSEGMFGRPETKGYEPVSNSLQLTSSAIAAATIQLAPATSATSPVIAAGAMPHGIVVSRDGTRAYVANLMDGTVSVISTATNTVIATIPTGNGPSSVALSPNGTRAYASNYTAGTVSVINTATNTVISTIKVGANPYSVAISPDGTRLYANNAGSNTVSVVNTATNAVVATIPVGSAPLTTAFNATGSRAFVANAYDDTITVIDTATNKVVGSPISVGDYPVGLAVSPDGTRLYVTNTRANTISVINTATNAVSATLAVGNHPVGVAVSADGKKVYIVNEYDDSLSILDTTTNTVVGSKPTGDMPFAVALSADGSRAYVTNRGNNNVSVISLAVAGNGAPVATAPPTVGAPNGIGVVTGTLNVVDPNGDPLTYTVKQGPGSGRVTIDPVTGGFTYKPTDAARVKAFLTPHVDQDTFSVSVSDGVNAPLSVNVTVTVSPPQFSVSGPVSTGAGPTDAASSLNGRTYVLNANAGTISVIDTATTSVIATIPVGSGAPLRMALSANGTRVYVTNAATGTVSVINTTTNTVTATVPAGTNPFAIAVNPSGSRVYVTDVANGTVRVIDTATNTAVGSPIVVGANPYAVAVSLDGTRVYAATRGVPVNGVFSNGTVSVIDTTTNTVVGTITVGKGPEDMAFSPTAPRLYVVNAEENTVSVINTANNTVVGKITVGSYPACIDVSPDGSLAYVTNSGDGTVSVIDTATNTVLGAIPVTRSAPAGGLAYAISVSRDGNRILVTDYEGNAVYTISLGTA